MSSPGKIKHFLFIDFETYYDKEYSLRNMSPPEYILDPRYETLLMAAFDMRWDAPKIIMPEDIPSFLAKYPAADTACCSHNALFDLSILSWRYGWVAGRLVDTLGMARALRTYKKYSLGAVTKELFGADTKGDVVGKVKGMHAQDIKNAGLWGDFLTYAMQDVRLCSQIYLRLARELPQEEKVIMDLVLRAAVQPVLHADTSLLEAHLSELRIRKARLLRECGYEKAALMSMVQFKKALEDLGVEIHYKTSPKGKWIPQFSKTDPFMLDLLDYAEAQDDDTNYAVQTLAAARLSHKSTIEETRAERFVNIAKLPWPDREYESVTGEAYAEPAHMLPVALRYGGAHTHRLSGEWKLNMQNLPRDKTKSKLREALLAPAGCKLITADLAQIEARIVAKLCGELKLVEQFRQGEDVYAQFATVVFHRVITKRDNPNERFLGKTAILGLGYGCGHERYYSMVMTQARQYGIDLGDLFDARVAEATVNTYRALFPRIPQTWRRLDHYLAQYINHPNLDQSTKWPPVQFMNGRIKLPNGLYLRYKPNDDRVYGAKLLENITQALARIVVMQAAIRLAQQGLRFVLQAHDELVFVVPDDQVEESKVIISEEMVREPLWLPDLPLAVELGVGQNYGSAK